MRGARGAALVLVLGLLAGARALTSQQLTVRGQVRDGAGPVAGARVHFQGDGQAFVTGPDGLFTLPRSPARAARLTASKDGYLVAGTAADSPVAELFLERLPSRDCEDYSWVDPSPDPRRHGNCGNCHREIYREWSASGHARSANGRHFRNLYDGTDWHGRPGAGWNLLGERPDAAGVCTACHAPTVTSLNDPTYFDLRQARGVKACGVHCDYCHKVAEVDNERIGLTHGRFGLKLLRPAEGQLFFGPLDDVDRGEDAFTPLYRDSRYCASCHEGTVFGVHAYGTYTEWLSSPAAREAQQCQTCHMAPTGLLMNLAPGKGGVRRDPKTLANHRFFAGSQSDMLRRCLTVSTKQVRQRQGVQLEVRVCADHIGHRMPTGFVDRNVVLVVEGLDHAGRPVPALQGPTLPSAAGAGWAGRPGRLYAKLLKDFDGHSPVPFWRADPEVTDSRLWPAQPDYSTYLFPTGVERIRVRLLYRRFWQEVAESKDWPDNEIVIVDRTVSLLD